MKRAEVWQDCTGVWLAGVDTDPRNASRSWQWRAPIEKRHYAVDPDEFPTHASALAHALHEVGLDRPAEHREAP